MSINNSVPALELATSLETKRRELLKACDIATLKTLLSPDIVYVHSTGGVDTYETYFEKLRNQTLVYLDLEYVDLTGTLFGDTLIVTGAMNALLTLGKEQKRVNSIYMATWMKQSNGRWLMCAHQGAPRTH